MHLERLLKQHRQLDTRRQAHPRTEPAPPLIERLAASVGETGASEQLSRIRLAAARSGAHRRGRAAARPARLRPPPRDCCSSAACPRRPDRQRVGLSGSTQRIAGPRRTGTAAGPAGRGLRRRLAGLRRRRARCGRRVSTGQSCLGLVTPGGHASADAANGRDDGDAGSAAASRNPRSATAGIGAHAATRRRTQSMRPCQRQRSDHRRFDRAHASARMMPPVTVRQRRSPAPCSPDAGAYETGKRIATRPFGRGGPIPENGGVSPSGSATWNTLSVFPISV